MDPASPPPWPETNGVNSSRGCFFSGIFDFSDKGKNSEIIGVQHLNEELFRDSFLGKIRPVTGFMITADSASYFYTGIQAEYDLGKLKD